jgi:Trypsin-like serine proteases, typically periplasmic, contain C-terminal PDZ domain
MEAVQRLELEKRFSAMRKPEDVATLLGVPWKRLRHILYRMPDHDRYVQFEIPKKSGGTRQITAPITAVKELQRALNEFLSKIYQPRLSTHGFAAERSIVSNALAHVGVRYVFNLDLADFFPSIHLGRVRGLFLKKPFQCRPSVATVLAQICCHRGKLPQGAPTSPIISNLICGKMDVQLQRFAREHACTYTRYADDITFSSNRRVFPPAIACHEEKTGELHVGSGLLSIIKQNTFVVNEAKLRLQNDNRRQVVTGLKVNRFPNVSRKLLSQVRAMLHAWKKFGLESAEKDYRSRYRKKHRAPWRGKPSFPYVVKGKIEFIGMVRGKQSPTFLKLGRQLRELDPELTKEWDLNSLEEKIQASLCVLEGDNGQGTGFFLKGAGLITCEHVLQPGLKVFKPENPKKRYVTHAVSKNEIIDLAILKTRYAPEHQLVGALREPKKGEQVYLCGFPKYSEGATEVTISAQIIGSRLHFNFRRYLLDKAIVEGNSGGPVIDMNGEVIGVAATGTRDRSDGNPDDQFGVIPLVHLRHLRER